MPSTDQRLRELALAMPKAELHVHLDGCLRVETALRLARTRDLDAPHDFETMHSALVPQPQLASQAELLRAFELPIRLMQDNESLVQVARELVEDKAADRVRYLEIKWAPALHVSGGLDLPEVIEAVCAGAADAAAATRTTVRLTAVAVRSHPVELNERVAETATRFLERGLTGFDFAGDEAEYPDLAPHRRAFEIARAGGLRITLHAGELRDGGAGVRRALELDPERIAHGVSAIADPGLCAELRARHVTLDLCPTSNTQAASVSRLAEHPLARLHRLGVPVSISTDDTTISNITLSREYLNCLAELDLEFGELWTINVSALEAAFADEDAIEPLRTEFEAWRRRVPELVPTASART